MSSHFDVIVIGAGPGGYSAAIRAAQLGLAVACIDETSNATGAPSPGGTCTNVGCIPSKALLHSSESFEHAAQHLAEHGIETGPLRIDLKKMQGRKDAVVRQNNDGISYLLKKNGITFVHGRARLSGAAAKGTWSVAVQCDDPRALTARHVIIATGSRPRALAGLDFDEQQILSNEGALRLDVVPQRLGVIGAGVIGLELGSVWRRLGSQVIVLEALPDFLPGADQQIANEALKAFSRQGLDIRLGVRIAEVVRGRFGVTVNHVAADGSLAVLNIDRLIVSIGRAPQTQRLGAEDVGLALDERGGVVVDDDCRTNLSGIWAIGDVVRGPMLAHKAEHEGVAVAERIAGLAGHVDLDTIPSVVYTSPEIAWVGRTEQQLQAEGVAYKAGHFPFRANGRARALGDTTGSVKILADAASDKILGVHIVGPMASELIAEGALAMAQGLTSDLLARTCHAHPTLGEAIKEAALAVGQRAMNF